MKIRVKLNGLKLQHQVIQLFCLNTRTLKIRLTKYVAENLEQHLLTQQESKCDNLVEIPAHSLFHMCDVTYLSLELEDLIFASLKKCNIFSGGVSTYQSQCGKLIIFKNRENSLQYDFISLMLNKYFVKSIYNFFTNFLLKVMTIKFRQINAIFHGKCNAMKLLI